MLAAYLVFQLFTATATDLGVALAVTGFAFAAAAALFALGRALAGRHAGARAPAIVAQLMLLPVGYTLIQAGLAWLGGPLMALGLLVSALLVAPPTNRALLGRGTAGSVDGADPAGK
jgi:hypothetical protein